MSEQEQQWDDDLYDEVFQTKKKGCSKFIWAAIAFAVAVLVIVPLTVTSIKKENEAKAAANKEAGSVINSPALSPAMAPAALQSDTGTGDSVAPAMAPSVDGDAAPTVDSLGYCLSDTQLVCPVNVTSSTVEWSQVANKIIGEASDDLSGFQISMSCDGSIVAVGASQNDGNGDRAGHVRVYRFNSTAWEQLGQDTDGEAELDWFGYSVSLASSGLRMAVGARYNDGVNGNNTGHVRIFDYIKSSGNWTQVGQDIDGEADGDQSGRAVSMSDDGSRVAIGATGNDFNATALDVGHVRVYELVDGIWAQIGQNIEGEGAGDFFGRAVALSRDGTKLAIGGYTNDGAGVDAGHVRVYELISSVWIQIGADIDGKQSGDWAGLSVDISSDGNRVAVGAPGSNDRFVPGVSVVYEFDDVSGNWTQLGRELDGGYAISLSEDGNRVAVGDYKGFSAGVNAGQVNVYEFDVVSGTWTLLGSKIVGVKGELSGTSVALSADGNRVAISSPAYDDDVLGEDVGATRIYDLC